MCGIVGSWGATARSEQTLRAAMSRLRHRGPDDSGLWADPDRGVAFGHTRLSILDLSPAGRQPMHSACGRYVIAYNGEIYNHLELRGRLADKAPAWRGHSDTETLLACFSAWGVDGALQSLTGMFAMALWDRVEQRLILARDRLGEKPLYYGWIDGAFAFASELKALTVFPEFDRKVDRGALALFLRHNYVPAPYSIYERIRKLQPGQCLELSAGDVQAGRAAAPRNYWSALDAARAGIADPLSFDSDASAVSALDALLSRAVRAQMLADVPLGAFLSGGVDSSTVVALMQAGSSRPIRTFSIGFLEAGYDEAQHAKRVARHLGTEHTELYVSSADALGTIPRLPQIYDEPFSDSSQIPTHLVAQLARRHVTVSLSGDGGDELFGGYQRYFLAARVWRALNHVPSPLRRLAARLILAGSPAQWDRLHALLAPFVPRSLRLANPGDTLHKGAAVLASSSGMALYRALVSHWDPRRAIAGAAEHATLLATEAQPFPGLTESMMALDAVGYLPDDILVKVDRAAMALGLETRMPFLDHRVFEFAWRLPLRTKIRGSVGKWLLRQVLYRYVPRSIVDRPKMGFGVPIGAWLRGPLREWAEELLGESRLQREGYFNPAPIRSKWDEHLSGRRNWQYHLWDVLMFQAWLERQKA